MSLIVAACLLASIALGVRPCQAAQHLIDVNEIYSNADGSVQYIELITLLGFQDQLATTSLRVANADGSVTAVAFDFVAAYPPFAGAGSTGLTLLVATPDFEAQFGFAPDFIMPAGSLFQQDGRLVFFLETTCIVPNCEIDAVAYGNYTGPNGVHGLPARALPNDGCLSLTRINSSNDNALAWAAQAPTPRRTDGTEGSLSCPTCAEVTDLNCSVQFPDVSLAWTNGDSYDEVRIYRDGGLLVTLPGSATAHVDSSAPAGLHTYEVEGVCPGLTAARTSCMVDNNLPPAVQFRRGDCNGDGAQNIADAVFLLARLFSAGPTGTCDDACDGNDDEAINIADAIAILGALFGSPATPLAVPYPGCGTDPSGATLGCLSSSCP